uniref:Uncharacterized protein n=1 Tax=Oryza sativa subsp. japonica TaxID=39947 RepID=Q84QM7_ORYSJ|nr:hypothetical protein [Oryza sativa Japonica Group]BAD03424.1 hypothetical protein [Oryza sativa Japonica Group]
MAESKKRGIRDWIGDSQRKRNRKPGRLFFLLPLSSRPPRLRLRGRETDGGFGMRPRRREMNSGEGKNSKHLSVRSPQCAQGCCGSPGSPRHNHIALPAPP